MGTIDIVCPVIESVNACISPLFIDITKIEPIEEGEEAIEILGGVDEQISS